MTNNKKILLFLLDKKNVNVDLMTELDRTWLISNLMQAVLKCQVNREICMSLEQRLAMFDMNHCKAHKSGIQCIMNEPQIINLTLLA